MFSKLARFLDDSLAQTHDPGKRDMAINTATAALLMEVARADFHYDTEEMRTVERSLKERFNLNQEQARDLMEAGQTESDESASLYRFTHALHEHLDATEKRRVIGMLWRVALADASLDKYEDSLMHKIAKLLYVPHGELMAMKSQALEEATG